MRVVVKLRSSRRKAAHKAVCEEHRRTARTFAVYLFKEYQESKSTICFPGYLEGLTVIGTDTNSTLRLLALPNSVLLTSTGTVSPLPSTVSLSAGKP